MIITKRCIVLCCKRKIYQEVEVDEVVVNKEDVNNYTALRCVVSRTQVVWSSVLIIWPLTLHVYRLNLQ